MLRHLLKQASLLFLLASSAQASTPFFQVDVIIFTHLFSSLPAKNQIQPILVPDAQHAIHYQILPASQSGLSHEYLTLNHQSKYQVLFHYSWLQPINSQQPIALPTINRNGWNVQGTIRIRRSNYYLLDTKLLFSTPNDTQASFIFAQKQRLKPGIVYYFDHPQAGMLMKIHQIT